MPWVKRDRPHECQPPRVGWSEIRKGDQWRCRKCKTIWEVCFMNWKGFPSYREIEEDEND